MGIIYHLSGKLYDYLDEHFEKTRYFKIRKIILKDLNGQILDAGCGTGRNFPHYNSNAKVIGIDISPKMLEVAKQRATKGKADIKVLSRSQTTYTLTDDSSAQNLKDNSKLLVKKANNFKLVLRNYKKEVE